MPWDGSPLEGSFDDYKDEYSPLENLFALWSEGYSPLLDDLLNVEQSLIRYTLLR